METNKSVVPFQFQGMEVRTVIIEDEIYFVVSDACKVLELDNVSRAIDRLDPDGVTQSKVTDSSGRVQTMAIANEPNLYRLIFRSEKPQAKAFQNWVYKEVIPSIRKTGSYSAGQIPLAGEWPDNIAEDPRRLALAIKGERAKLTYLQTLKALRYPELITRGRPSVRLLSGPPTPEHIQAEIIRHLTRLGELTLNTLYNSYMKRHNREEVERQLALLVEEGRIYQTTTAHSVKYFVPDKSITA